METYVLIPLWVGFWLLLFVLTETVLRLRRIEGLRPLYFHFRVWQIALLALLGFSFTLYEKTSLAQTLVLSLGPVLSLLPILRFWWMRRRRA